MKKMNLILRKCKSLSRQLGRSSSYSSLRSKSTRQETGSSDHHHHHHHHVKNKNKNDDQDDVLEDNQELICVLVGSTRKRYLIRSKHFRHPLVSALVENPGREANNNNLLLVKCEVVFFDHLLWMLDNADPINLGFDSFEELAHLYTL